MARNTKTTAKVGSRQKKGAVDNRARRSTSGSRKALGGVGRIGFWSALLSGLFAAGWAITLAIQNILVPPQPWAGIEALASSFRPVEMLNLIPAILLPWPFIVMMVCIHYYAAEEKKVWSLSGLAISIVYAVMASSNYFIQLVAVRPNLLSGETDGLALFVAANPNSIFWALANAYPVQSFALLLTAWVFDGGRRERWIRWIFIAVGATVPVQLAFSLGFLPPAFALPALGIWVIGLPVSCFLIAALFRGGK